MAQGSACDQREGEFARGAHQAFQRLVGRVEQRLLQQEVAAGVGRDAQFGERHDLDAPARAASSAIAAIRSVL